ncbi:MAG: PIG-L family deacetylase [Meiothermus sp.]|uniref:PIG-L deacetylase family protein n=1 Tax=Meiothermus sp. TaxID=1955249 RepID=UPI0025E2D62E|nr:PIG-L deacetylase family protein [Meiothermus sp.]MCS7058967.1 PIG-L family deacetylase [Meiothermus sp.]MCS7195603.1 PIG-L family deacetylase [Meiothermus sp.]MCX7741243.1 PIG-L family deacetylase [Meiothermus sp.]MDW8091477.1 PIG-L deacetylase family protein [Meiothermus sp.]MDW8480322.1 PIG-L deacetylase family protein [Meiothermus sp.]
MRLLAVFAHPDDESFFCGGTLAWCASMGHSVYLVCATRGEQGEIRHPDIDPGRYPKGEARGRLRQAELEAACQVLGLKPPIFLGYQDSGYPLEVAQANPRGLIHQSLEEVEEAVLEQIVRLRPHVVIGFDPKGYYGHPDHIHLHRATLGAFWRAGNRMDEPPRRLFFPVRPRERVARTRFDPDRYGVSSDSIAVRVDVRPHAQTIRAALLAHRSQIGPEEGFERILEDWPGLLEEECFALGGLRGAFPKEPLDLLAGL